MDFENTGEITALHFDRGNTFFTMNIPILDDDILEYNEIFFANLTKTDNAVILQPDTAEITIIEDNDGNVIYKMHKPITMPSSLNSFL